jgi:hypothetical protein
MTDSVAMDADKTLWCEVLLRALQDLQGVALLEERNHAPLLAKAASDWFVSRNESVGSLIWICGHLGLDAEAIRDHVLKRAEIEPGRNSQAGKRAA